MTVSPRGRGDGGEVQQPGVLGLGADGEHVAGLERGRAEAGEGVAGDRAEDVVDRQAAADGEVGAQAGRGWAEGEGLAGAQGDDAVVGRPGCRRRSPGRGRPPAPRCAGRARARRGRRGAPRWRRRPRRRWRRGGWRGAAPRGRRRPSGARPTAAWPGRPRSCTSASGPTRRSPARAAGRRPTPPPRPPARPSRRGVGCGSVVAERGSLAAEAPSCDWASAPGRATKRTCAPGVSRAGGVRVASQSGASVRPISCQPPGELRG